MMQVKYMISVLSLWFIAVPALAQQAWQSRHVKMNSKGRLSYIPDEKGNVIPDFSKVGYKSNAVALPIVPVRKTVMPSANDQQAIQDAIDEVAKLPLDKTGFRGAVLLKEGVYEIPGTIQITTSGIVLRGEGKATKLVAVGKGQRSLISVTGKGAVKEIASTRVGITGSYIPVGAKSFRIATTEGFKAGDSIIVFRPGTAKWIHDLQMDQIEVRDSGTKQWPPGEYDLHYERVITRINKDRIYIDNPIVMAMEEQYGGGAIYRYQFNGRINNVGIENMACESEYINDTDEDHGWNAVLLNRVENAWVKNVSARHFGYSCVNLGAQSRNITVDSCQYTEPKSQITGSRRYSFNNDGQLNLIKNCFATEGRHDYITGYKVCGPNVFYNCRSEKAKADIGPHHRWSTGTLYDNIITDGEINIQDRGNWGTGHGWAGVNQVIWNCVAAKAAVQDPWVSGKNYVIGLKAARYEGRLKGRPQTEWEGNSGVGLIPPSLFRAQTKQ